MTREIWATYSVRDHLDPRTLAADIMLYDRLVFPVPQDWHSLAIDPTRPGPVKWTRNETEWARWEANGWNPQAQERLLSILDPVVRKIPWDPEHQDRWHLRMATATGAEQHLPEYAFNATRTVLTQDLPAHVEGVAAIGPAYASLEAIEEELGVHDTGAPRVLPGALVGSVLAWKHFIPTREQLSDEGALRETVAFVQDDEFRQHRAAFRKWQIDFLRHVNADQPGPMVTDDQAIQAALNDMNDLLREEREREKRLKLRCAVQYAFMVVPSVIEFVVAGDFDPKSWEMGEVFLSFGSVSIDKWFFKKAEAASPTPVAFIHDARRHFGWKD